jgi:hypothetical protein
MRTRGRRAPPVVALVPFAAALLFGLAVAVGATAATETAYRALPGSVTYQDSTGEDPNALDIGTVVVSNDDTGLLTFDVRFVNGSLNAATDEFFVVINSDRDESTGEPDTDGADWFIGWAGSPALLKWNGTDFVFAPSMKTLVTMPQPNGLLVKVNASELGNVKGFDFYVKTYRPNPTDLEGEYSDWAPEREMWSYDVKVYVAPVLTATQVRCTPDPPRAGKPMVARTTVTVKRGTAAEPLGAAAKIKATATIGGKKVAGTVLPGYASGKVAVRWLVPATAKGKVMRGTITVTLEKVSVTRTFVDSVK